MRAPRPDLHLGFETGPPLGGDRGIGLIVLQTDETLEAELRQILPATAPVHASRIPMAPDVSGPSLAAMAAHLPEAARLLPRTPLAAVAYGCTSGATVIGPDRVAALVREGAEAAEVTNPLSALLAACHETGARRVGFVTPYLPEVSAALIARLEAAGLEVTAFGSFREGSDPTVARITPASVLAGILAVGRAAPSDAILLSCTNLQTLAVIPEAEAALGRPVLSSNLALGWHLLRLGGLSGPAAPPWRLLAG